MDCDGSAGGRRETPFHDCKNECHHVTSALALADRWTWWSRALTDVDASIRLRKKVLPGWTTDAAWLRRPIKERRSRFVPERRGDNFGLPCIHWPRSTISLCSLSCGRRSCRDAVSISIPKNVRVVEGPSVFSSAIGTPSSSQRA